MNHLHAVIVVGNLVIGAGHVAPAPSSPVQVIRVTGMDYALRVADTVLPGRSSFRFRNAGKVRHELAIGLLKPGATVAQFVAARRAGKGAGQLIERPVGVLFAGPGRLAEIALGADLLPERDYVLWCALKDSASAPAHAEMGMFQGMHVAGGPRTASAPRIADTVVAVDYAFTFPAVLPAGLRSLAFRNAGAHRHELKLFALREGQTLGQFMEERQRWRQDTSATRSVLPPTPALGVILAGPGGSPDGVLEVRMKPGSVFALVCDFADEPNAPQHTALGMIGSVTVRGRSPR